MGTARRVCILVFAVAGLTWAVLIVRAIGNPKREPHALAEVRTGALVVAFLAGSVGFPRRPR